MNTSVQYTVIQSYGYQQCLFVAEIKKMYFNPVTSVILYIQNLVSSGLNYTSEKTYVPRDSKTCFSFNKINSNPPKASFKSLKC